MAELRRFYQPVAVNDKLTVSGGVAFSGGGTVGSKVRQVSTETSLTGSTDAIDISLGDIFIIARSGGVNATTLAAPAAGDEGRVIWIRNGQAQANTITVAGSGLGGSGTSHDVITLGNVLASNVTLRAAGEKWYLVGQYNCTVA